MRKITIAFITLFILLLSIAPATATVSFIDLSAPSSASPGESFTISATAYDPSYSITAISMSSAKGKTSTYSCTPAHTCTQKFLITKYSAGAYTYTITSKNDIGQSASKTVTVNVKNPTINMPNLASVFSSSSSRSVYPAVSIPIQSSSDVSAAASTKVKFHWVMAAIDGPSMDNNDNLVYLNPSSVKINNVGTKSATPFTQFNVSADTRYDIFYSSNGYTTDGDVFLFDSRLPSCPVSGCDYTQGQSRTTCDYNATSDYFRCTVNNPNFGGPIAFDYYKNHPLYGANTVEVVNELFKPHCPIVYGMTNATFINGINYTGLDLDSYVYDDNTAKSDLIWTVTRQDNVSVSIGMSNIITVRALNSLFSGNDIIR
ncbi:MAG: hypothetical protein NT001_00270, partial [Candidatus Woesearchaeota archaeon]|nr:hypothetical protein [Candidatus Woesearchaeota archaeon]